MIYLSIHQRKHSIIADVYVYLFINQECSYLPGNLSLGPNDRYHTYIARRSDIDTDGYFDIIAHGTSKTIEIVHNGISKPIDHRVAARLFKNKPELINKPIRLLSCNTGRISHGFAQGLADRLNVPVIAPTDYIWANPDGTHFIAAGKTVAGKLVTNKEQARKIYNILST